VPGEHAARSDPRCSFRVTIWPSGTYRYSDLLVLARNTRIFDVGEYGTRQTDKPSVRYSAADETEKEL